MNNQPTFNIAKAVIPFEADTTKVDAALDKIEARLKALKVAPDSEVRSERTVPASTTTAQPQSATPIPTPQQGGEMREVVDILRDLRDSMRAIEQSLLEIGEAVQGVNKL